MRIRCTRKDYEKIINTFHSLKEKPYEFVPTRWELERYIIPNIKDWVVFLLWLKEMGVETTENKVIREEICKILDDFLIIAD